MVNIDNTSSSTITAESLPAILIGGPPRAGKSVLTYELTRELRRREIQHYVFRASTDGEGDWRFQGNPNIVYEIQINNKGKWSDIFRALVCRDLSQRYLPLLVDLGGLPTAADNCIFHACTHSVLLLKEEDKKAVETWGRFTTTHGLVPLAKLHSQLEGKSILTAKEPTITGTITGLVEGARIHNVVFDALVERICQIFSSFTRAELEKFHLDVAPIEFKVHLPDQLHSLQPDTDEWSAKLLQPLLAELPAQTAIAVYGRAPNWVYGALALHAGTQPFYQFDVRLGWVTPPALQASANGQAPSSPIKIDTKNSEDLYLILIHPIHNYLDYREANQLVFPEPPPNRGVVVSGKLPLWLFTALARFYVQRDVPWIALNDARENQPIVIYSRVLSRPIGTILPKLALG
ncbi:MAG: hypothetical protein JO202_14670 [Ktedonobacteraceae bacterium]|nr:hypothetical protein [Ktedonobacteraceae bacterium]